MKQYIVLLLIANPCFFSNGLLSIVNAVPIPIVNAAPKTTGRLRLPIKTPF